MTSSLDFSTFSVSINVEPHEEHRQLEHLYLTVTTPGISDLARVTVLKINRRRCGSQFLAIMDEDEEELAQFSRTLFDKFGHVKQELVNNEYHKGSGCWAEELNHGLLIYVSRVVVDPGHRRQGVGSWALKQLLGSKHVQEGDTLISWPASEDQGSGNNPEEIRLQTKALDDGIVHFFRKNGFRRIGRTQFLGLAADPSHASHSISMADDPDKHANRDGGILASLDPISAPIVAAQQHGLDFPLHMAIFMDKSENITGIIRSSYDKNPDSIQQHDENGLSPLAIAAVRGNYLALKYLLELGVQEDLSNRDNSDSLTPLEFCEGALRSAREFSETLLGKFGGHDENMLKCRAALMRAMGIPVQGTDEEFATHAKLGCTCGSCVDGWLSARMKFRLEVTAEVTSDITHDSLIFHKGRMDPEIFEHVYPLSFIPLEHRARFYKRDCYDFGNTFALIKKKLAEFNGSPLFLSNAPLTHRFAMDAVIHDAQEQSPLGDDTFDDCHGDSPELDDMPTCVNDLEFELVREMMGLSDLCGPYSTEDIALDDAMSSDESDW